MKKICFAIVMAFALSLVFPHEMSAKKTKEETAMVKEISGGLPVYMGNGMTWNTFDIDDDGQIVIGLISQNLPDASEVTDEVRNRFHEILVGPNSGYVGLSKSMGKGLRVNVYNPTGQLCISETYVPD